MANAEHQPTILVVDDDSSIAEILRDFLEANGFRVHCAPDAKMAKALLNTNAVDCIVLDIMLPEQTGFDLCRDIRRESDVPILFLSALDSDIDKIRGLGLGGDDYIVKSATPAEVVARVKAVLRRSRAEPIPRIVRDFGRLVIDVRAHEVLVEGRPVSLTAREYNVLLLLSDYPRQVFTAEQLLERFWGEIGEKHTVTVHIQRIREKIEEDPRHPRLIVTVWGIGYRFEGTPR